MSDYSLILSTNYAGKQWALNGDSYAGLNWLDKSPKPTQAELDALWQSTKDQVAKDDCKATAKTKLAASDWSVLPDVEITNKSDFENYRAILRNYVINPVVDPTWPTEPQSVWN